MTCDCQQVPCQHDRRVIHNQIAERETVGRWLHLQEVQRAFPGASKTEAGRLWSVGEQSTRDRWFERADELLALLVPNDRTTPDRIAAKGEAS